MRFTLWGNTDVKDNYKNTVEPGIISDSEGTRCV